MMYRSRGICGVVRRSERWRRRRRWWEGELWAVRWLRFDGQAPLHESAHEDERDANLVRERELQPPDHRERENEDDEVGDDVH